MPGWDDSLQVAVDAHVEGCDADAADALQKQRRGNRPCEPGHQVAGTAHDESEDQQRERRPACSNPGEQQVTGQQADADAGVEDRRVGAGAAELVAGQEHQATSSTPLKATTPTKPAATARTVGIDHNTARPVITSRCHGVEVVSFGPSSTCRDVARAGSRARIAAETAKVATSNPRTPRIPVSANRPAAISGPIASSP